MLIGGGEAFNKALRNTRREGERLLHENKMKLLEGIAEQSTKKELPETDPMVQYLEECSAEKRFHFAQKIRDYINEMEGYTATIEANLARQALIDLEKGDYKSSRLKRYERFLRE